MIATDTPTLRPEATDRAVFEEFASYDLLATFSLVFGIPLSFTALVTGVILARRSKWGRGGLVDDADHGDGRRAAEDRPQAVEVTRVVETVR